MRSGFSSPYRVAATRSAWATTAPSIQRCGAGAPGGWSGRRRGSRRTSPPPTPRRYPPCPEGQTGWPRRGRCRPAPWLPTRRCRRTSPSTPCLCACSSPRTHSRRRRAGSDLASCSPRMVASVASPRRVSACARVAARRLQDGRWGTEASRVRVTRHLRLVEDQDDPSGQHTDPTTWPGGCGPAGSRRRGVGLPHPQPGRTCGAAIPWVVSARGGWRRGGAGRPLTTRPSHGAPSGRFRDHARGTGLRVIPRANGSAAHPMV
jgi:hypothetical protein